MRACVWMYAHGQFWKMFGVSGPFRILCNESLSLCNSYNIIRVLNCRLELAKHLAQIGRQECVQSFGGGNLVEKW